MGNRTGFHRPLLSGIRIKSPGNGAGTLTGLATRNSDGKKVLVTNLHLMDSQARPYQVADNQELYQEAVDPNKKVGRILDSVPVVQGQDNVADVAICELLSGVDAEFALHNHPNHDGRQILAGVVEPKVDMVLTMLGARSGESTVTVKDVDETMLVSGFRFTGMTLLDRSRNPGGTGDSGAPYLAQVAPDRYRMCCIGYAGQNNGREGWAFPASVAESELGITFGDQHGEDQGGLRMGIPILTSEGFVGQRWIIDDYFQAGEALHAGDVVGIKQAATERGSHPRVFKATSHKQRVIGIVHTPASKQVGNEVASAGTTAAQDDYVPIVVQGIAKALSGGGIGVGDPVVPSGNTATGPATGAGTGSVATVVGIGATTDSNIVGRSLSNVSAASQIDVLVDLAGNNDHTHAYANHALKHASDGDDPVASSGQGTPGPAGPQGSQGEQGPPGPKGDKGEKGDQGEQGIRGRDGDPGDDGSPGSTGDQGPRGYRGRDGDPGEDGSPGSTGDTGPRGPRGYAGENGEDGSQGPPGPRGPQGPRGPRGYPGSSGGGGGDDDQN